MILSFGSTPDRLVAYTISINVTKHTNMDLNDRLNLEQVGLAHT